MTEFRVRLIIKEVTEKGLQSPEFMRCLYDRVKPGGIVKIPPDYFTRRFEAVT